MRPWSVGRSWTRTWSRSACASGRRTLRRQATRTRRGKPPSSDHSALRKASSALPLVRSAQTPRRSAWTSLGQAQTRSSAAGGPMPAQVAPPPGRRTPPRSPVRAARCWLLRRAPDQVAASQRPRGRAAAPPHGVRPTPPSSACEGAGRHHPNQASSSARTARRSRTSCSRSRRSRTQAKSRRTQEPSAAPPEDSSLRPNRDRGLRRRELDHRRLVE